MRHNHSRSHIGGSGMTPRRRLLSGHNEQHEPARARRSAAGVHASGAGSAINGETSHG